MTSKEKIRLKLPFKKNRIILPHKVTQAAQQVQATIDQLPLDFNATTPTSHYVRHPTQQLVQPPTQQVAVLPIQPNKVHANPPPSTLVAIGNKTQGTRCSNSSHGVAPDGRTMIWPDDREWLPCRVASRALTSVITSQYVDMYPSWRAIPELALKHWFDKFGEKFVWLPEHNFQIKNIFNTKGSKRLSDMLMQARKNRKCPT
uniref:Uncharacterized protein LOC101497043 n=1 Tax=Cicer arietinum TaxID=3827 RepID=A0A3Q7WWM3_CICAR|nr:uncharacterized protein LOC101497043 [Cicer arietinum]